MGKLTPWAGCSAPAFAALLALLVVAAPGRTSAQGCPAVITPVRASFSPDRSQARIYDGLVQETAAVRAEVVTFVPSALDAANTICIHLAGPPARVIEIVREGPVDRRGSILTWVGHVGPRGGSAILVARGQAVVGVVRLLDSVLSIRPLGGDVHAAVDLDPLMMPDEDEDHFHVPLSPTPVPAFTRSRGGTVCDHVDAVAGYTEKARAAVATTTDPLVIELDIEQARLTTNKAFDDSNVDLRLKIVHSFAIDSSYDESSKCCPPIKSDFSTMQLVLDARLLWAADVAILFHGSSNCIGQASVGISSADSFAVVSYTYAASNFSLAHELGHFFTAEHNNGFCNGSPRWHTIMARGQDCPVTPAGPRIGHFSNPAVSYSATSGGASLPTGQGPLKDSASILIQNACSVTELFSPGTVVASPKKAKIAVGATINILVTVLGAVTAGIPVLADTGGSPNIDVDAQHTTSPLGKVDIPVTALSAGTATVTLRALGATATVKVKVVEPPNTCLTVIVAVAILLLGILTVSLVSLRKRKSAAGLG